MLSDDDLAREARGGSLPAFEQLARRLQVPLIHFLSQRFPSRRDAEDLTQETLLRAYRCLDSYDPARSVRTWVFTIAYRLAVSGGRGQVLPEPIPASAAAGADPAVVVEGHDLADHVWRTARNILTGEQYDALWLFYAEGLPAPEIASVLARSHGSVKTMLSRARERLTSHLSERAPLTEAAK
jgi:RNA polymerase sigma-70 factor (ECF subfamily)